MAPQRRKSNTHLPANVYFKHNAYYWRDKKLKWHRLGKTLAEAMRNWSEMMERPLQNNRMDGIFDRYLKEIVPQKATSTFKNNIHAIKLLKVAFGHLYPHEITPVMIYRYMDLRKPTSLVCANKEKAILSHAFSYAIRWGVADKNPCKDVKSFKEPIREYYIPDDDFWGLYHFAPTPIQNAMYLDLLTGLRLGDLLRIQLTHITEKGLEIKTSKTQKHLIFELNESLDNALKLIKASRGNISGLYLICNERGQKYTEDGFKTVWRYWMNKAITEGIIKQRFQFKDIRKKAATDIEKESGLVIAQKTLGHTSSQLTDSVYVVGARKVKIREIEIKKKANDVDK